MSKEKDNIIQALDNIAITFDEYGFEPEPIIPILYGSREHFNEWFAFEIEIIKSNAIKQEQQIDQLKQQLAEKDEEIEDLKEWQDWYSMWHKKFQKQIEDLTTELETYRPTKLHGNGQCECYKCKQEGRQARKWTDWCSRYKGHTYCDDCLKEVLKEEQTPQTQLAIQEFEEIKRILYESHYREIDNKYYAEMENIENVVDQRIKWLEGENNA